MTAVSTDETSPTNNISVGTFIEYLGGKLHIARTRVGLYEGAGDKDIEVESELQYLAVNLCESRYVDA